MSEGWVAQGAQPGELGGGERLVVATHPRAQRVVFREARLEEEQFSGRLSRAVEEPQRPLRGTEPARREKRVGVG